MKKIKISCILCLFLFFAAFASATRYIKYDFKDGVLFHGGYTQGTNSVTGVSAVGYVCGDAKCSTINSQLWNSEIKNSGANSYLVLTYPTSLQSQYGYGVIFYKPGYIGWEQGGITYAGPDLHESYDTPTFGRNIYMTKVDVCRAQVDEFVVINEAKPNIPLVVDMVAKLDATTHSVLEHADYVEYVPEFLKDEHFSFKTNVELQIVNSNNEVVYDEDKDLIIEFSGEERTSFTWTPTVSDSYTAVVTSYVTDEKCLSSESMGAKKNFKVLEEEPEGMCYTLLNNLKADPLEANEGETVKIDVEKISNFASQEELYALPTKLTLEIFGNSSSPIYTDTITVNANEDNYNSQKVSFEWTAGNVGRYGVKVTGIAENCPFDENIEESQTILYYVYHVPQCSDGIDNDNDGAIDYPDDFGCSNADDDNEVNDGDFQCNDGIDNDDDTFIDQDDPMCERWDDDSEFAQCNDNTDNDEDGWIDMEDTGCEHVNDDDESYSGATECSDELDNDNDGLVDGNDPMCIKPEDITETAACQDNIDNDKDNLIDMDDPGCIDANDNDEYNEGLDLYIDNGYLENAPVYDNEEAKVTFTTHNIPGTVSLDDVPVRVYLNDDLIDWITAFNFPSKDYKTSILFGNLEKGSYTLKIEVDSNNDYPETDEENNLFEFSFDILESITVYECNDGIDNDGDGAIDYPDDFGCSSAEDDNELNDGVFECNDGIDNDYDTFIDQDDPDCDSRTDDSEAAEYPECSDGIDNDGDGAIDYPDDFGCSSAEDDNELNDGVFECNDGFDNDYDTFIDQDDPDCDSRTDDSEAAEYKCYTDSDCGDNNYIGSPYCQYGYVYQEYATYRCAKAGTADSYCMRSVMPRVKEECEFGCSGGFCQEADNLPVSSELYVTGIRFGVSDAFYAEDQMYFSITLKNDGKTDMEDLGISVLVYDLGIYYKFGNFVLKDGNKVTKSKVFDIPYDVPKGIYDMRVVVSNDDVRRVIHREVTIV